MQCNIDARGKRLRLVSGLIVTAVGIGLLIGATLTANGWWLWAIGGVVLAAGAFQVFEARAGWCALRAMGVKTPL